MRIDRTLSIPCVLALGTIAAAPRPATKDEVEALATRFPVLAAPDPKTPPFIARGSMPHSDDAYDYEIVWTGTRYRAAMLDADDGTPLIVGDETRMLACDVAGNAFWIARPARFAVTIEAADDSRGLSTSHFWEARDDAADLPRSGFDLRAAIRRAAEGSTIETLPDGATRLVQPIDAALVRIVQFAAPPSRDVAFGQFDLATRAYTSYHTLTLDAIDVADPTLAPPDFFAIGNALSAVVNPRTLRVDGSLGTAGYLGRVRRAMRGDAACRSAVQEPGVGWATFAERDAAMYARFRGAFRDAGLAFTPPDKPWAATLHDASPPTGDDVARGPTTARAVP